MASKLIVVIPSRKDENLNACLAAIRKQDPAAADHVVVVDDGLAHPPACAIPGKKPFCFARNANIGILATGGAADVILLNDDAMLVSPLGFTRMQAAAAREVPPFGIISAAVEGPSNSPEHAPRRAGECPRPREAAGFTIPFICVFIPRSTINTVGLLEERFTCYGGDDDDYCYRVRSQGHRMGFFDGCVVDHRSLVSTFRPHGGGLPIDEARRIFREIHGFEMATK
jgi:GT2 family glycosyltransferase